MHDEASGSNLVGSAMSCSRLWACVLIEMCIVRLARAKQQRATSAGQTSGGAGIQRASLGAHGEDSVSDGSDEVAQEIDSPEEDSVTPLLSGVQSAGGQWDNLEAGGTSAAAQPANGFSGEVTTSMDSNEEELARSTTRSEAADTLNRIQILSRDFVNEEQHVAVQIHTEGHTKSLQATADSAEVKESRVEGAPQIVAASNDSALDAYISGRSSVEKMHGDDEVLSMSTGQGSPETTAKPKGSQTVAERLAGDPYDALRCAQLAQQTEVLHTKITAAIARIRTLETEKALAARALATVPTSAATEVPSSTACNMLMLLQMMRGHVLRQLPNLWCLTRKLVPCVMLRWRIAEQQRLHLMFAQSLQALTTPAC